MIEVKVPVLPESISEATVALWHKQPGDLVQVDDVIVEIETDKVVLEIPAEEAGVLSEIIAQEGQTVGAQQILGLISEDSDNQDSDTEESESEPQAEEETKSMPESEIENKTSDSINVEKPPQPQEPVVVTTPPGVQQPSILPMSSRMEERVPMTRLRKTIATKLHSTTQNSAMLTTFNEVDMSAILSMRKSYKEAFEKKYGVKLGFMSFFVKAAVESLKKYPTVNAYIDGDDIVYHGYCDVSVAVSSDRGLVVPVLRDAHKMAMHDIEKHIVDYASRAQAGSLTLEEMMGGTFTISNGGVFGSLLSTPILNSPQSAILGMHKIGRAHV